jgi:asparagine synthase (glutamine-hydrolysing)
MCGVAGFVGVEPLDAGRVARALALMQHRGPDNATHKAWPTPDGRRVELLHTRLTIIDIDHRSDQPFRRGRTCLAFNGELYNYVELRRQLERAGETFSTASDTEVLAAVLDRDGWHGLDGCEGMWALAAYDERDGSLLLSRDRFGEKPLYVLRDHRGLFFGSEPKFIFALIGRALPVNRRHLERYLVNGYKSLYKSGETFFTGLEELEAGTALSIGSGGHEQRHVYWRPGEPIEHEMSFDEAAAGARERLIRSVELRLRSDVPLAFCMSGGVDSLSIISIASKVLGYDVHGFTIVNSDERYDEEEMVAHAIDRLGVRHTPIPLVTAGFLPRLRELVRHHDAPVYTVTYFVQWLLLQSIHEHGYRVSISGTAADELFTGYYDHHLAYLYEVRRDPALAAVARDAWSEHVRPLVRNPYLSDPDLFVEDPGFRGHIYLNADEFATYLTDGFDEGFGERSFSANLLRNRMLNELFAEAVPVILHEDDLNAMYFSIENRSPFLDRDLFEFSTSIPTRHLVRDARAKAVLRAAMRGIVPDLILDNRRKVGFNAPIHSLLDVGDPSVRAELLADSPLFDIVRRDKLESLLAKRALPNSESKLLFNIVCTKLFLEEAAA